MDRMERQEVKPVEQMVSYVVDSARRNATCWLNAGPTPAGEILAEEMAALREEGARLREQEIPARS